MTTGAATAPRITIRTAAIRPRIDVSQHVYMRNRPRLLLALARDVLVDFSPSALDAGIELVLENDGRPTAPVDPRGRDTRPRYCRSGCGLLMCAQRAGRLVAASAARRRRFGRGRLFRRGSGFLDDPLGGSFARGGARRGGRFGRGVGLQPEFAGQLRPSVPVILLRHGRLSNGDKKRESECGYSSRRSGEKEPDPGAGGLTAPPSDRR